MAQLKKVVDPFGEVNVHPTASGKLRVQATILMEPHREGTQTGVALDGSGSMANLYGVRSGGFVSPIFQKKPALENQITPVAQSVCAHLARKLDADGGTTCIYWATGPQGSQIEVIGDFTADQAESHTFGPPKNFGTGTQLLPAVRYFAERFADAPWGFYVFITDGELHDLSEVKEYSRQLARAISNGKRPPLKLVLIGIGPDVNEKQMQELDDLDSGTNIDLWDHKLAAELRVLEQIFAEVVDKNARVAPQGKILTPDGQTVKDYSDTGVPTLLEFEVPANTTYFTLEIPGYRVNQGLSDTATVPGSVTTPDTTASKTKPVPPPLPNQSVGTQSGPSPKGPPPIKNPSKKPVEVEDPTLEGLDFKLEMEKDIPSIKLEKDKP